MVSSERQSSSLTRAIVPKTLFLPGARIMSWTTGMWMTRHGTVNLLAGSVSLLPRVSQPVKRLTVRWDLIRRSFQPI